MNLVDSTTRKHSLSTSLSSDFDELEGLLQKFIINAAEDYVDGKIDKNTYVHFRNYVFAQRDVFWRIKSKCSYSQSTVNKI